MTENRKTDSVYFRTIISLALCTIFVFAVLCIVYFQRTSRQILSERSALLYETVQGAVGGYRSIEKTSGENKDLAALSDSYFCAMAVANQSYIWIVEPDGLISYSTAIPNEAITQLIPNGSDYSMSPTQMRGLTDQNFGGVVTGTQNGLFYDTRYIWLSAAYPLDDSGKYLVIHKTVDVEVETFWMLSNNLAIPIIVSFALALLLFTLMTRSLVRPIRLLSAAARSVTQGDLTARIHIPELERESPVKYAIADELSEMVTTVNHMIERLEKQDSDRRVFLSSIAHDLRTPLTSIKGFLTAMLDGTVPPEKYEYYLQITKAEVDRIQALTASMTEASSIGKKENLKMTLFDMNDLIQSTLVSLEQQLQDKKLGVQLETFKDKKGTLMALGDRESIARVVYNLIVNAIKFTPEKGDIAITTDYHYKSGQVVVSVEDSGPGIPKDKRQRVFESFYKIDQARTNPGSGLGLYICKEIMAAHGQSISVDSSPILGGARFTFTLKGDQDAHK